MHAPCTMLSTFLPVVLPAILPVVAPTSAPHHQQRQSHNARQAHMLLHNPLNSLPLAAKGGGGVSRNRYHAGWNDQRLGSMSDGSLLQLDQTSSSSSSGGVPLVVTNQCREDIYPGILSQAGTGPKLTGFRLGPGDQSRQAVSVDWQGRVWGRTNCSFNQQGTAAADGSGVACGTGDCGGTVGCMGAGVIPVTLAEFTLDANGQTFYDISLVDGYNLPLGIVSLYPSSGNATLEAIPPNLTNPVCIGTASELASPGSTADSMLGTNGSFPLPLEESLTAAEVGVWCPWDLQLHVPTGTQSGVYTYPEGALQRPAFDPCYSACAKTGQPQDCCTGNYDSPSVCKPSIYSADAKMVCPDAYSYAFDDQTSTFIIPAGGGFEIVFCPPGRSTTILATYKQQLSQLAQGGLVVSTTNGRVSARDIDELQEKGVKDDDDNDEQVSYSVDGVEFRGARLRHPAGRFGKIRKTASQDKLEL